VRIGLSSFTYTWAVASLDYLHDDTALEFVGSAVGSAPIA